MTKKFPISPRLCRIAFAFAAIGSLWAGCNAASAVTIVTSTSSGKVTPFYQGFTVTTENALNSIAVFEKYKPKGARIFNSFALRSGKTSFTDPTLQVFAIKDIVALGIAMFSSGEKSEENRAKSGAEHLVIARPTAQTRA